MKHVETFHTYEAPEAHCEDCPWSRHATEGDVPYLAAQHVRTSAHTVVSRYALVETLTPAQQTQLFEAAS